MCAEFLITFIILNIRKDLVGVYDYVLCGKMHSTLILTSKTNRMFVCIIETKWHASKASLIIYVRVQE